MTVKEFIQNVQQTEVNVPEHYLQVSFINACTIITGCTSNTDLTL